MSFFTKLFKKDNEENEIVYDETIENTEDTESEVVDSISEIEEAVEEVEETEEVNIAELIDEVLDYFTQVDPIKFNMLERGKLRRDEFEQEVRRYIDKITNDADVKEKVFDGFASFVWRYDIIDELIDDDEISDIKVYDWDHIRVKRNGKREDSPVKFRNEKHYLKFVEHTAIKNKISISDQNAAQNFVDKTSSNKAILRFNITTGFINSNGKYVLAIRKIPKQKLTTEELIKRKMLTYEQAEYFRQRVVAGDGILVSGKGGSGKTTFINWLLEQIPNDYSGLVIQENEELFSSHPDMAFEHTVENRGEGKIEYNLGDLARNGLLTDIDYFIIGEIKGGEALYLLNAVYTGAKGIASVHGASSTEAMNKLVDYIKYNSTYSQDEALKMLVHLDTVVFMKDFHVTEVSEVIGYNEEKQTLDYKKVF